MTTELTSEKRMRLSTLIDELIQERQQVWSLYCQVADMKPYTSATSTQTLLTAFCQILVDYISLGHFGIYQHIVEGKERRNAILRAAESVYPEIAKTTELAIAFNEKYSQALTTELVTNLELDLSSLGESLAQRNEAEDQLCEAMLS